MGCPARQRQENMGAWFFDGGWLIILKFVSHYHFISPQAIEVRDYSTVTELGTRLLRMRRGKGGGGGDKVDELRVSEVVMMMTGGQ